MSKAVILFDGVCNLCNASVAFIIKNDPEGIFHFAPLQSDFPKEILQLHSIERKVIDSIVLIEDGNIYCKSTAVLKISRKLRGIWPVFYVFIVVPKPIRDLLYDLVARYRYSIFGKRESCMLPDENNKSRFLKS